LVALVLTMVGAACSSGHADPQRSTAPSASTRTSATTSGVPAKTSTSTASPTTPATDANVYAFTHPTNLSAAVNGVPNRVYVPNSGSNTVDVIDPATFQIVGHFGVGAVPQHVVPSWDLTTLYVANNNGNSLTPIDPRTSQPGPPIPLDDPYNLYFTPDGAMAVVIAERHHRIDFRDPHTWTVIKSVRVPCRGVDHGDFSADGQHMVLSCEFSGDLLDVDLHQMTIVRTLHTDGALIDVKVSPDGRTFFVADQRNGGVALVDWTTFTVRTFVPTGTGAHGLLASRDATQLYVSNRGAGSISVLDFATGAVRATWHIGGSPDMGGVSVDGSQLWVSGRYDHAVYVVDTRSGQLLHRIPVGAGPHGLSVFPQPGRFSVGHTGMLR
jgi:YVTN family beta-propeller protein